METMNSRCASKPSAQLLKKGLFQWRTVQGYRFSVKQHAEIYRQWNVRKREKHARYRLRRNNAWYRSCLNRKDSGWAFKIRRCL